MATPRSFVKTLQIQDDVYCFDPSQNIHNTLMTFMIRSNFTMKQPFNEMLKRIITSGLIDKWQRVSQLNQKFTKNISKQSSMVLSEVRSLDITDLYFAHIFAAFSISASFSTVYFEKVIHLKANSVNCGRYWKFLDKVMCGRRSFLILEPKNEDDVFLPFAKWRVRFKGKSALCVAIPHPSFRRMSSIHI